MLGIPLVPIDAKEVGAQGVCMMLSVVLGVYKTLKEAKSVFVKMGKTYYPNEENKKIYDRYFAAYKEMYSSVRPIIRKMGE
jgi:sugar (pentulose or hexulose) kinase